MHVLLPPSETKRDGGSAEFRVEALSFPGLTERRVALRDALVALAGDRDAAARALKLGPRQLGEIERNAALPTAPAMPAVDRFDGVLFDALEAASLSAGARGVLGRIVVVQSALWGPVRGLDGIPAYRLSHDSRLPELPSRGTGAQPTPPCSPRLPDSSSTSDRSRTRRWGRCPCTTMRTTCVW